MKKTILTFAGILISLATLNSQNPWQKISIPLTKEVSASFKNPPAEYGMILWWGWDGRMSDTVIKRDLDRIRNMGFRGVMIEAGYGMSAKYLSPEWFSMVKLAIGEAKTRGMKVWIEDEGKYPSGFAGGKFSMERPDLKMQGLVVTERFDVNGGDRVEKKLPWYAISAAAYRTDGQEDDPARCITLDVSSGTLRWTAPEGKWRIFVAGHRFRSSVTRSVNNPTRGKDTTASLMDYLNPLATKQFISWTHEQYKLYFGEEFGKTFMGLMGDEPDFAYTPWTPGIIDEFMKRKGYDVTPLLASFFVPKLSAVVTKAKADYWDVWSDLFRDNFFTVQAEWCRQNNIDYIVHLNHEDQLTGLVRSSGDFFKNMRNVGVPGVDAIWAQIWPDHVADYPKLASSAAHLYGKPRAFTESFAAFTHKPSVAQAKWVLDYQLVRGINSVQVMFMSASTPRPQQAQNNAPQQRPANQPVPSPAFFLTDTFPPVADYINRTAYLLSQGKPAATVGLYFPTLSMWYGDNESNDKMLAVAQQLTENQYDFDFIDEQALSSVLKIEGNGLTNLSGQSYKTLIVPPVRVISRVALSKLEELVKAGGKVIILGEDPELAVEKNFMNAVKPSSLTWAERELSGKMTEKLFGSLGSPDFKIDKKLPQVKYLHRTWKDADLFFIFNESQENICCNATFGMKGKKQLWDASTGMISAYKGTELTLAPRETKFIIIKK